MKHWITSQGLRTARSGPGFEDLWKVCFNWKALLQKIASIKKIWSHESKYKYAFNSYFTFTNNWFFFFLNKNLFVAPGFYNIDKGRGACLYWWNTMNLYIQFWFWGFFFFLLCYVSVVVVFGCFVVDHHKPLVFLQPIWVTDWTSSQKYLPLSIFIHS